MQLGRNRIGQQVGNRAYDLVLRRGRDLVLARHQGIESGLGHHGGVVLVGRARLGVHHLGTLEEVRFRHARHQHGDADAGVLQFLVQRLAEPAQEHLGAAIHRLERVRHGGGDRGGEHDPPCVARHHVLQDQLGELHGAAYVDVDHRQLTLEVGFGKGTAEAEAGIDTQRIHRPPCFADRGMERIDLILAAQITGPAGHGAATRRKLALGLVQVCLILSGDQDIEAVGKELAGQLEADTVGTAGDDGEGTLVVGHLKIS